MKEESFRFILVDSLRRLMMEDFSWDLKSEVSREKVWFFVFIIFVR